MNSYGGTILRINLTDGTIHRHPTEEHLARAFLGGRGLNVKRLWDELPAHTDGLSPQGVEELTDAVGNLLPAAGKLRKVCTPPAAATAQE